MKKQEKPVQTAAMRLPSDLMQWLKHQAVDNKRSLNGEVHHRLQQSREKQEAQHAGAT